MLDELFTYSDVDHSIADENEEAAIIEAAQAGDEIAALSLMNAYGRALRSAVARFTSAGLVGGVPVEDLRSAAIVAFLEVIAEHDPALNPRLAGRVSTRLIAALAKEASGVTSFTIPERTLSRFYGILREADGDVEVALDSVGDYGMSRETFLQVLAAIRGTDSLDGHSEDGADVPHVSTTATPLFSPAPVVDVEDKILVDMAFAAVEDEEARICELAYGFTEYEPVPDAEIAHRLDMTRPTVQHKRGKALSKMRKALGATPGALA